MGSFKQYRTGQTTIWLQCQPWDPCCNEYCNCSFLIMTKFTVRTSFKIFSADIWLLQKKKKKKSLLGIVVKYVALHKSNYWGWVPIAVFNIHVNIINYLLSCRTGVRVTYTETVFCLSVNIILSSCKHITFSWLCLLPLYAQVKWKTNYFK